MVFLTGIEVENIHSITHGHVRKTDVAEIKHKIQRAGLVPYEAKYWRVVPQ